MASVHRVLGISLIGAMALTACAAPGGRQGSGEGAGPAEQPAVPKRITVAFAGDPPALSARFTTGGSGGTGTDAVEGLMNRGLTTVDSQDAVVPQLAEAVPTVENGLWQVFPDGRMETTWKLRENARWHDGTPVTSDDLLFTWTVDSDRDLPFARPKGASQVASVEAPDPRTITVKWRSPYIDADAFFQPASLPRHLLERTYLDEKSRLTQLPYWTDEYVGTGPYRLQEWQRGSHIVLRSNDDFCPRATQDRRGRDPPDSRHEHLDRQPPGGLR